MDIEWYHIVIIVAIFVIASLLALGYYFQTVYYNSIPIYDKACDLNYSQTWDNAYKFFFIDTSNCNINNVEHNK